jgi:antitoxin component YwqK of YwqJK toxin-antitoxin module
MKKITLILLFIICKVGLAQSYEMYQGDTINYIDASGKRQKHWVIFGRMKKEAQGFAADAKVEEGNYTDSKKTGVWISYFPNGKKQSEYTYENNRPFGHAVTYYENGKIQEEGTWKGTRWVGDYKLYYEDGKPRQSFSYNPLGQRDGKQLYYHPNGQLAIDVNMKAGKEEGVKKEFYENGDLKSETTFNGGSIDPAKTKTFEPKKANVALDAPEEKDLKGTAPEAKADMKANPGGKPFDGNGPYILYRNGQITMKGTFKNKKLIEGEERIYDNNNILIRVKLYKDGKYVGDGPLPTDANK